MDIIFNLLKIVLGFVLLIKGADFFVDGASAVALKLGVPQLVIGLTIVAFGTSAPEAAVSISAGLQGNNGISIGNVIGSNILNILLILGVTSVIRTLKVKRSALRVDMPVMIAATIIMVIWGMTRKTLTRVTGIIFLIFIAAYLLYLTWYSKHDDEGEEEESIKDMKTWLIPIAVIGGMLAIIAGSNLAVNGASNLATRFGVSDRIIGLTIIALGTSLPELVTSVVAARKGNADIAIGNIVGSCIFNVLFILGFTTVILDLPYISENVSFIIDGIVVLVASILLYVLSLQGRRLTRKDGIIMLIAYAGYFIYLAVCK